MNTELIDCFIELVNAGSLSKASDRMHLSQSAVSKQLILLEKELGVPLVMRGKGVRQIRLTSAGEKFMEVAKEYLRLRQEALGIQYSYSGERLRIGCSDAVCNYVFADLFSEYVKKLGDRKVTLQVNHPNELFTSLLHYNTDIVYTHASSQDKGVISRPLYSETYSIVVNDSMGIRGGRIDLGTLDPHREVFTLWFGDFLEWHMQLWGRGARYIGVTVFATAMIFLKQPGYWAYVPSSIAETLLKNYGDEISTYIAEYDPPLRICYVTERNKPGHSDPLVEKLKEDVYEYLSKFESIRLL